MMPRPYFLSIEVQNQDAILVGSKIGMASSLPQLNQNSKHCEIVCLDHGFFLMVAHYLAYFHTHYTIFLDVC